MLICRNGGDCQGRHDDGRKVTVNVKGSGGCSGASGCLREDYGEVADGDGNMNDLELIIEEPAKYRVPTGRRSSIQVRLYWTNDRTIHLEDAPATSQQDDEVYVYLPRTAMHEFGHTLGLHDLYRFGDYDAYLMGSESRAEPFQSVPSNDLDYLSDVYENHSAE